MSMEKQPISVTIVGAGLVGTLAACILAKRGYNVKVYEKRKDIRNVPMAKGKSINLALSKRGILPLRLLNIEEDVLSNTMPMIGRCLHLKSGRTKCIEYDAVSKQFIRSINRNFLNEILLKNAENQENVLLKFEHKLTNVNPDNGICAFLNLKTNSIVTVKSDLIIGADGAYSTVRKFIQQTHLFTFAQTYIDHGYIELNIEAEVGKKWMIPNYLHIWPRKSFMLIALPNQNYTWTVTLFMPLEKFKLLNSENKVLNFFKNNFPDMLSMIGNEVLVKDFFKYKPNYLISIKCDRFHYGKCAIIGDAAHAMVPFYGQGMNAGFEDCMILNEILNEVNDNILIAIRQFSIKRVKDVHAINDLAMYNYLEMRDLVNSPIYKIRAKLDNVLFYLFPELWIPLYISITFTEISYSQCLSNRKWQNSILKTITFLLITIILIIFWMIFGNISY